MAEDTRLNSPQVLPYEPLVPRRDWALFAARVVYAIGLLTWLLMGIAWYDFRASLSDSPGPLWFEACSGVVVGGVVASPVFGLALLVERFGRHITSRCSGPAAGVVRYIGQWVFPAGPGH